MPLPIQAPGSPLFDAFGGGTRPGRLADSLASLAPGIRREVEGRLEGRQAYRPRLTVPPGAELYAAIIGRRRQEIEGAIVALAGRSGVEDEAAAYAGAARLFYEWEGEPRAFLDEAESASTYLTQRPATPLAPYLRLFLLHHYRCAFEAFSYWRDRPYSEVRGETATAAWKANHDAGRKASADRYRAVWQELQQSADVVVKTVAEDIDAQVYLYMNGGGHPRTSS